MQLLLVKLTRYRTPTFTATTGFSDPVPHSEQARSVHEGTGDVFVVGHVDVIPDAVVNARSDAHLLSLWGFTVTPTWHQRGEQVRQKQTFQSAYRHTYLQAANGKPLSHRNHWLLNDVSSTSSLTSSTSHDCPFGILTDSTCPSNGSSLEIPSFYGSSYSQGSSHHLRPAIHLQHFHIPVYLWYLPLFTMSSILCSHFHITCSRSHLNGFHYQKQSTIQFVVSTSHPAHNSLFFSAALFFLFYILSFMYNPNS